MNALSRKALFAGVLGNAIEWYDFALYGHFSVVIGELFFPKEDPILAMLSAFAVFSVSFFMRPVGAVFFSYMGDRFGRKKALSLSMLGMAIPTAGIGLLPPYAEIGGMATVFLVLLRLVQGFSLGGEMGGAVTYVMEHTPEKHKGLASSLIQASTCMGLLLGTLVSGLISMVLTEDQFMTWGWRLPFILGLGAAWVGFRIRTRMPESLLFETVRDQGLLLKNPIANVIRQEWRSIAAGIAILIPMTCSFFFAFVYFNSYMIANLHYSPAHALQITSGGLIIALLSTIVFGWLADQWGYLRVLGVGVLLLVLGVQPLIFKLSAHEGAEVMVLAYFGLSLLIGIYTSSAFLAISALFDTPLRYSGVSLAVNIASPLFGSTIPMLATWIISAYGQQQGFNLLGGYLMLLCAVAALTIRRLYRKQYPDVEYG